MGDEAVEASKMGVVMVLFAALMVFIVTNVVWGEDISRKFQARMDRTEETSQQKYFSQASQEGGINTPMAGAYSMIEYNIDNINTIIFATAADNQDKAQIASDVNKETFDNKLYWLRTNLNGRCNVKASKNNDGTWDVKVTLLKEVNA